MINQIQPWINSQEKLYKKFFKNILIENKETKKFDNTRKIFIL